MHTNKGDFAPPKGQKSPYSVPELVYITLELVLFFLRKEPKEGLFLLGKETKSSFSL